ncbi:MAG: hypothetical protein MK102_19560, partial [Fuerstiella sp.]|nr:hypothetical protein [Fuerstiella sp.]
MPNRRWRLPMAVALLLGLAGCQSQDRSSVVRALSLFRQETTAQEKKEAEDGLKASERIRASWRAQNIGMMKGSVKKIEGTASEADVDAKRPQSTVKATTHRAVQVADLFDLRPTQKNPYPQTAVANEIDVDTSFSNDAAD